MTFIYGVFGLMRQSNGDADLVWPVSWRHELEAARDLVELLKTQRAEHRAKLLPLWEALGGLTFAARTSIRHERPMRSPGWSSKVAQLNAERQRLVGACVAIQSAYVDVALDPLAPILSEFYNNEPIYRVFTLSDSPRSDYDIKELILQRAELYAASTDGDVEYEPHDFTGDD